MCSLGHIFAYEELLENRYFSFQCGKLLHQGGNLLFWHTSFELEVEPMDKWPRRRFGSVGGSLSSCGRQTAQFQKVSSSAHHSADFPDSHHTYHPPGTVESQESDCISHIIAGRYAHGPGR